MRHRVGVACIVTILLAIYNAAAGEPVRVRFSEGASHGFLVLRNYQGDVLAHGEYVQEPRGTRIENRLTFRFKDGSLWDETVTFTQLKVFRLMSYRLVQRGPSFPEPSEVTFERDNSRYHARIGDQEAVDGKVDLPDDLHNGMTSTLLKNLARNTGATGHLLVFTPKPQLLDTELRAEGEDRYFVGTTASSATRFLLKIDLRGVKGVVASKLGKEPPDVRYWISTGVAPAFVKFEGPMFLKGPHWRIELSAPRWPDR